MPVLVVGADTPLGQAAVDALLPDAAEVRVFITDPAAADRLKEKGAKVAIGDVSDESHVGAASMNCFSVVFIADAATDDRVRSFTDSAAEVIAVWARALHETDVRRVIWVSADPLPRALGALSAQTVSVEAAGEPGEVAAQIAAADAKS